MINRSPQLPSLSQVIFTLAAIVILLGGVRVAAPILNPFLFALILSLLFSPLYAWLRRQRVPDWLALICILIGLSLLFGLLFYVVSTSITSLATQLGTYADNLSERLTNIITFLQQRGVIAPGIEASTPKAILNNSTVIRTLQVFLGGLAGFFSNFFLILMTTLFLIAEGPALMKRLRTTTAEDNPLVQRLTTFGQGVVRQFGLRGIVNAVTGTAITIILLLLGIDFAVLWGFLTFFLSYIPYIGTFLAAVPGVLLAFAEFGLARAVLVILGFVLVNIAAENILSPALMSRGLSLSPTLVFVSFAFWVWLLGGPGAFLGMPITLLILLVLDSFPESRWITGLVMVRDENSSPRQTRSPSKQSQ
jgi:predicted PurR-regulated permease PerM